ncbi:MAG: glycoside hydrolase family 88 protein [Cyclobacteriaceae bacterium]|nr:glycoside hydrolase family 88 protein [Cyclobacteriaceae bacterium]
MKIDFNLNIKNLKKKIENFWELSGKKIRLIGESGPKNEGAPVFTVEGKYTSRGWTEWTQGFLYGSAILQYDVTGEEFFLELGKNGTLKHMTDHLSHMGVHDHGFNNISTYGNLLRLMVEGKVSENEWERNFYELALKVSGAVQGSRWTRIEDGGFIYSFNGPHSLFVDTIRSVRILMLSHMLGQKLYGERDMAINLLERGLQHIRATARYSVFYGEGKDIYDIPGRVAHESIFNTNDGSFRCNNSQQGFSGYTTWTRGLAWAILGFAEELEFLDYVPDEELKLVADRHEIEELMLKAAKATSDFYIKHTPVDGIPYWDTGAPGLNQMKDYLDKPADPFNDFEPVDSSAAAIAAQGLIRLGKYMEDIGQNEDSKKYGQAGLTVLDRLLGEPYISSGDDHQGLILHSIYHRPGGWDHRMRNQKVPSGESSMWGDYHARELALYVLKMINEESNYRFFNCL